MAPAMAEFLEVRAPEALRTEGGANYDRHIREVILKSIQPHSKKWQSEDDFDAEILDYMDPSRDTLPYLHVLSHRVNVACSKAKDLPPEALKPGGLLWDKLIAFFEHFNPIEVRYSGELWRKLLESLIDVARSDDIGKVCWKCSRLRYGKDLLTRVVQQIPITRIVAQAILRLDPSAGTYTSLHLEFVRLSLELGSLSDATAILDHDIFAFPASDTPEGTFLCAEHHLSNAFITRKTGLAGDFDVADVTEYYLLGAMVYIGFSQWTRALFYLEHVLAVPTTATVHAPNSAMVEAYRKWVLVKVLCGGKSGDGPKLLNGLAMKHLRAVSKPYEAIAEAFKLSDPRKLRAEIYEAQRMLIEDDNDQLAHHILEHHRARSVTQLGNIYTSMPLTDLQATLDMSAAETEEYLDSIIKRGMLLATVEQQGLLKNLRFPPQSIGSNMTEAQLHADLEGRTKSMRALAEQVGEAERRLSLTKEFLEHTRRGRQDAQEQATLAESDLDPVDVNMPMAPPSDEDDEENVMTDA